MRLGGFKPEPVAREWWEAVTNAITVLERAAV